MSCGNFIKKNQQHSVSHQYLDYVNQFDLRILWIKHACLFFLARPLSHLTFIIHMTGNPKKIQTEQNFNTAKDLDSRWAH